MSGQEIELVEVYVRNTTADAERLYKNMDLNVASSLTFGSLLDRLLDPSGDDHNSEYDFDSEETAEDVRESLNNSNLSVSLYAVANEKNRAANPDGFEVGFNDSVSTYINSNKILQNTPDDLVGKIGLYLSKSSGGGSL